MVVKNGRFTSVALNTRDRLLAAYKAFETDNLCYTRQKRFYLGLGKVYGRHCLTVLPRVMIWSKCKWRQSRLGCSAGYM